MVTTPKPSSLYADRDDLVLLCNMLQRPGENPAFLFLTLDAAACMLPWNDKPPSSTEACWEKELDLSQRINNLMT
jgi:hypothetical protein